MPFFLIFDLKTMLPDILNMLYTECPLARYYTDRQCVEFWFAIAVERIMMLECTSPSYPNAEEYLFFNLNKLDHVISKFLLYPNILDIIRRNEYYTFQFFFNAGYDGVIIFDK